MTGFPRRTGGESFLWPHKNNHARLLADTETGPPLQPPLLTSALAHRGLAPSVPDGLEGSKKS